MNRLLRAIHDTPHAHGAAPSKPNSSMLQANIIRFAFPDALLTQVASITRSQQPAVYDGADPLDTENERYENNKRIEMGAVCDAL